MLKSIRGHILESFIIVIKRKLLFIFAAFQMHSAAFVTIVSWVAQLARGHERFHKGEGQKGLKAA